ncbi:ExbD/TolR family protein [Sulfurimonas sp.]|uniref:ExbD/TolR family protein n=1 Tax=Sulfurimonas sp. TaxID=2022749 RepID=UPI003D14F8D8
MAKCKKTPKRFDQINVIPFIDIMLVLLVMVLTTATFVKQGIIPVDLPQAQAQKKQDKPKELNIYIDNTGKIFLDKEELTLEKLEEHLKTVDKDTNIILRSDKQSRFQDFVSVMDILKKLEHEKLYIVTKEQ